MKEQEKQLEDSAEGGEKQGVRHGEQALPTPQGWSSGRKAGGEGPGLGLGHSPPWPPSVTRLLCLRHHGAEAKPESSRTAPWLGLSRTRGQADAVSGRWLSVQPTERLCSSISGLGPFRQLLQPINEGSHKTLYQSDAANLARLLQSVLAPLSRLRPPRGQPGVGVPL